MWSQSTLRESLYLVLLAALCFTLQLGSAPLFDGDEGRAAVTSWTMWQSGNFLTPHFNGVALLTEPPLFYWLQALSSAVFGLDEPGFRLPSSLAACVWMLTLYAFCRTRMGASSARAVAMFMAASLAVSIIGRSATPHALMNLWVTLALLDAYRWSENPRRSVELRLYLWMALGILTQGFAAVLIPILVTSIYFAAGGRLSAARPLLLSVRGWALFLLLSAPWFGLMLVQHGSDFVEAFVLHQWGGLFPEGNTPTSSSPMAFLGTLPLVVVPFSVLALVAMWRAGQSWQNPLHRFALSWLAVVLVVFSLPGAELPHQLLLGGSPLFILMARFRETLKNRWILLSPLLGFAALAAAYPFWLVFREVDQTDPYRLATASLATESFTTPLYLSGAALFLVLSFALCVVRKLHTGEALLAAGFLQAWFVGLCLLPAIADSRQLPVRQAARHAAQHDLPVVVWATRSPSFSVYRREITPHRPPEAGEWVFSRLGRLPQDGAEIAYQRGGYILFKPAPGVQFPIN